MQQQQPDPTVSSLAHHSFPARAVANAAGISGDVLTNYLTKSGLELCSVSRGQGKPRDFLLIDVYQIALMARLVRYVGRVSECAKALNNLLFERPSDDAWLLSDEFIFHQVQRVMALARDVSAAHPVYWTRHLSNPWFIRASF